MKFKLTKVTREELKICEIVEIEEMIYNELGLEPVGTHRYIRIERHMSHLEKNDYGVLNEVTPVRSVTEFLMVTEYPIEYFQIRAIVKRRLPNFEIKLGW